MQVPLRYEIIGPTQLRWRRLALLHRGNDCGYEVLCPELMFEKVLRSSPGRNIRAAIGAQVVLGTKGDSRQQWQLACNGASGRWGLRVGAPEAELTRNPGIARCLLATKAPAFGKPRFAQTVAQQPVAAAQLKPALDSMHHEAANERVLLPINRARLFGGTSAHRKTHPFHGAHRA